jgi:1,4-dihydroxy-2-naphthoate octaprenyltransferase
MGYLSAGMNPIKISVLFAAVGVALIILSLYPISQLYQMDDDRKRGDRTFAIRYGFTGVFNFFVTAFAAGILFISGALYIDHVILAVIFMLAGFGIGYWVKNKILQLTAEKEDYELVMRIKFGTSLLFVAFILVILLIKHTGLGILLGLDVLLM